MAFEPVEMYLRLATELNVDSSDLNDSTVVPYAMIQALHTKVVAQVVDAGLLGNLEEADGKSRGSLGKRALHGLKLLDERAAEAATAQQQRREPLPAAGSSALRGGRMSKRHKSDGVTIASPSANVTVEYDPSRPPASSITAAQSTASASEVGAPSLDDPGASSTAPREGEGVEAMQEVQPQPRRTAPLVNNELPTRATREPAPPEHARYPFPLLILPSQLAATADGPIYATEQSVVSADMSAVPTSAVPTSAVPTSTGSFLGDSPNDPRNSSSPAGELEDHKIETAESILLGETTQGRIGPWYTSLRE